ncbi:serine/threonine kinase [Aureococcus anophagefferens]|nr:serine/threonine kinase [Aureococcus anophagefferens]
MATEAAAPPPSPPARRLSTPKPLDVVADHAASCGDLIRPKSLVEEVRARKAAAARAWNGHDLVSLARRARPDRPIRMSMKTTMRRRDMGCVELFKYYDADGSGTVDKDELSAAVRSSLQLTIRQSEVDTLMDQIDKDGNGDVDTDEFAAWLFAPGEEPWLDDERRYGDDDPHGDKILLARDMARFDPVVMKLLDAFWRAATRTAGRSTSTNTSNCT